MVEKKKSCDRYRRVIWRLRIARFRQVFLTHLHYEYSSGDVCLSNSDISLIGVNRKNSATYR